MNNWVSVYNIYQPEPVIIRQHAVCVLSQAKGKKRIKFCKKTCLNGSEKKKKKRGLDRMRRPMSLHSLKDTDTNK